MLKRSNLTKTSIKNPQTQDLEDYRLQSTKREYFQYIRKICTNINSLDYATMFSKVLKRFNLDRPTVEALIDGFIEEKLIVRIEYHAYKRIVKPCFTIGFYGMDGLCHVGHTTLHDSYNVEYIEGRGFMDIEFDALYMRPGLYRISVSICSNIGVSAYAWHQKAYRLIIEDSRKFGNGLCYLPHKWNINQ